MNRDDKVCYDENDKREDAVKHSQSKKISFWIEKGITITDYIVDSAVTISALIAFSVIFISIIIFCRFYDLATYKHSSNKIIQQEILEVS